MRHCPGIGLDGESMLSHPLFGAVEKEINVALSHSKHFLGRSEDSIMGLFGICQSKLKRKVRFFCELRSMKMLIICCVILVVVTVCVYLFKIILFMNLKESAEKIEQFRLFRASLHLWRGTGRMHV